jgi:hypothetical protein
MTAVGQSRVMGRFLSAHLGLRGVGDMSACGVVLTVMAGTKLVGTVAAGMAAVRAVVRVEAAVAVLAMIVAGAAVVVG